MGGISAEVLEKLAQGISQVIDTEWDGWPLITAANNVASQAESIMQRVSSISWGFNGFKNQKEVVNAAAKEIEISSAITGIKTKMGKLFSQLRRDHSSSEDDEFRSLIENAKGEMTEELSAILNKYFDISKKVAEANAKIYQNNEFKQLQQEANRVMSDGYQILNKIGEAIHGTTIIYEVQLSVGTRGSQRTAYMTLDQIMQYTTATYRSGEMALRLNEAAVNAAIKNGTIQAFSWSDSYRQSFMRYTQVIRENQLQDATRDWDRNIGLTSSDDAYINRGNVTEAFRRAAAGILEKAIDSAFHKSLEEINGMSDHDIHYMLHTQIQETLSNTIAYWQGPDFIADLNKLFNGLEGFDNSSTGKTKFLQNLGLTGQEQTVGIQEKIGGASFTTLNSLVTSLRQASNSLSILKNKANGKDMKSYIDSSVAEGLDEEVEQAVLELVSQFLGV